ncbi:MAG: 2-oxoglutarate dehydrogenase complex dihydrolipoyllysine-residue succinyltransferase [Mesorhizobium sp.]|nr:MAG: 2-oxoglutarate dehydrogenase complex dihydrolipoyllysine-residue succinyltransferase [Mesorhizobium sp.]
MNWITNYVRPKINSMLGRRTDMPENLWIKDPETGEMVFHKDLESNQFVIPSSGHHMKISAKERLKFFFDDGKYETLDNPKVMQDPLKFRDEKRYVDRLKDAKAKTGLDDAIINALGTVEGLPVVVTVQDFAFMGGSLGMAAGDAIVHGFEVALQRKRPLILFAASGGARMQEGILSLMQLPRTTVGVDRLKEAGLPYIVVLTNPTTGGVTASYAMLGDVHIAEPGALIGFAGPRVIEQTIREKLPDGFQRSEYLMEHGMVDMVVSRLELRQTIARRLKEAQSTAAMLTTFNEVDMSAVMALRTKYKDVFEKKHGVKLGFMGFFTKAVTHALKEIPSVNAEIDGTDIIFKNYAHIGVAVGTEKGLVVPVVRDADQMSIAEIEKDIGRLGIAARDGKLSVADMQGGTFTISNGGVYGSLMSTPILNAPQSGILGMHKIQDRPVVVGGQIVIRPMMYLALSYDHRIVDGKEAVTFLVRVKESLEDPERLVLDL